MKSVFRELEFLSMQLALIESHLNVLTQKGKPVVTSDIVNGHGKKNESRTVLLGAGSTNRLPSASHEVIIDHLGHQIGAWGSFVKKDQLGEEILDKYKKLLQTFEEAEDRK